MKTTKKLIDIIGKSSDVEIIGDAMVAIRNLEIDSRKVESGDVFIAVKGHHMDGHNYISSAIEKGASVIVCEDLPEELMSDVTYIVSSDNRTTMAEMSKAFFSDPSSEFKLVGVTGTNGKTTVATLLWQLFTDLGFKCGLVSTVENKIGEEIIPSTHTTPDNISLNRLLRQMADAGCDYVFMEVSSHAIDQRRIEGVHYSGGVFTNMSHDHLDYHPTFKDYIWTKKKFFDPMTKASFAIINIDDKRGEVMVQNSAAKTKTYALKTMADYKGKIISNEITGLTMTINDQEVHFKMVGEFNAYNLLSVYGTAMELLGQKDEILLKLSGLTGAEGRFEIVMTEDSEVVGIVDYAHTPDALDNVLKTIAKTKRSEARVICVVGCGGDRDRTKRPIMAQVGYKGSDQLILTSDNPRTEDPEFILDEMMDGLDEAETNRVIRITQRAEAIEKAIKMARAGDIILVAGKGHEKYQDINGVKTPFDDKKVLKAAMQRDT